ncbi:hypothetical protein [Streptomyces sp. NPDC047525]|uniref:hypothetical protein n=1 Tax=Streptomyces sp. NPDC047525 TaxID=3155264 RepID=UPI0033E52BF0
MLTEAETESGRGFTLPPPTRLSPRQQRPLYAPPRPAPDLATLQSERAIINRAATRSASPGPARVLLYALTGPDRGPGDDLAAARGYAAAHELTLVEPPIVDTLDPVDVRRGVEAPLQRAGYTRALRTIASSKNVHGLIAVSYPAISPDPHLYDAQLLWFQAHTSGLWLVRSENTI